jgi:hypothetical protein
MIYQKIKQVPLVSLPPQLSMEPFSALAEELLGMYYKLKQGSFSMKDNQCNAKLPFITSVHRGTKKENMIPRQNLVTIEHYRFLRQLLIMQGRNT